MIDVNQILAARSVASKYGAPLGRREYVTDPGATVYLQKVQMVDGDYDAGGAYWGAGPSPLYCALNEADTVLLFIRALHWYSARTQLNRMYPGVTIEPTLLAPDDAQWWCDSSGRIELQIGLQDAHGGSHSGDCNDDIAALATEPYIARQLAELRPDNVREYVRDAFADATEAELADHPENLQRLLWLACCDLVEQEVIGEQE